MDSWFCLSGKKREKGKRGGRYAEMKGGGWGEANVNRGLTTSLTGLASSATADLIYSKRGRKWGRKRRSTQSSVRIYVIIIIISL